MTPAKKRQKSGNDDLCIFCENGTDNSQKYGQKLEKDGITVHYFCMLFASGLSQNGKSDKEGILGFLMRDIFSEVKRGRRLRCTYCKKTGATVGCVKSNCRRAFHFGCGRENGALSQFFGNFSSYCQDHCPKQEVPVRDRLSFHGTANTICAICMCAVEARASNSTLRAPCCKNAWFHRNCMQRQAIYSGIHFFKCALCNNKEIFQDEMLTFGIYIPDQDAAWELEPNAYHDLLERHSQCDVKRCMCSQGRRYNKDNSNWEIILCDWCGSKGTHIICSAVDKSSCNDWICDECSNVASKMGSTKKSSHAKKPQIDNWLKKKFAGFRRRRKLPKQKQPLAAMRQSYNIRKRCRMNTIPDVTATATCTNSTKTISSVVWSKPSSTFTAISPKPANASTKRTSKTSFPCSSTTKDASPLAKKRLYSFRGRILRKNLQSYDGKDEASSPDIQKDEVVGCILPAVGNATGRSSRLASGTAETDDFEGKPRWYRQLMTADYLTGRSLGAQMVKWKDDLWSIKNAVPAENAKPCSTALGSVDSEPSSTVTASTSSSPATTSDSDDVQICEDDIPAVSRPETDMDKVEEPDRSPSPTLSTHSPITIDDSLTCDSYPNEILPISDDYRIVLDSPPIFDLKAGISGTCSWDDDNANCLCLSYCPAIEIDLTQDGDSGSGNNTGVSIGGAEKTPEFIDLTELQELSEQDGWNETGTDSGIGESTSIMCNPPSLSRPDVLPPPLSRAPDVPPVLTPAVPHSPYSDHGRSMYGAPLVNVGYFTIGPVTSYR